MLKKIFKKLYNYFSLEVVFIYDYFRFRKYHATEDKKIKSQENLKSWILMDKHKVEKALSLPSVRTGFGEELIKRLYKNLNDYRKKFDEDRYYKYGIGAIKSYVEFHEQINRLPEFIKELDLSVISRYENDIDVNEVGTTDFSELKLTEIDVDLISNFMNSRHSCRNFNNKTVPKSAIEEAIVDSLKTPSVCNRQHWHCHIAQGEAVQKILKLQTGNNGFNSTVQNLAIITSDLSAFYLPSERQQPFVDGGMFAMSFIYSLHARGISSCALNWSAFVGADLKVHDYIPNNQSVIMMIAFGYASDEAKFANSPRKKVEDTCYYITSGNENE